MNGARERPGVAPAQQNTTGEGDASPATVRESFACLGSRPSYGRRAGRSVDLTFALDAGSCTPGACAYGYDGAPEALVDVLSIATTRADGDTLASFVAVVRLDGPSSTNTGSFSMSVEADSEPDLDGFSATFTLRSGGTVIELGG